MKLADKPCYPFEGLDAENKRITNYMGLTYKEALVLALAGNHSMVEWDESNPDYKFNAKIITEQADAIIKEMEK